MIPKGQSLFILMGFNNLTSEWRIIYSSLFKSKKREEEVIKEKSKDYLFLIPYEVNNKYSKNRNFINFVLHYVLLRKHRTYCYNKYKD